MRSLKVEASFQMMKTPLPYKLFGKYKKLVMDARTEFKSLVHREFFINDGGVKFYVYQFNSKANKKALVVHGWMSESPHMLMYIKYLIARDYQVICLDLPGHGRSPKAFLTWQKAVKAILSVDQSFGPFDLSLGHSFGGGMLMNSTSVSMLSKEFETRFLAKKHVLIASALSVNTPIRLYTKMMQLSNKQVEMLRKRVSEDAGIPFDQMNSHYLYENFPQDSKIMLIHGTKDFVVDIQESQKLAALSENIQLVELKDMGHFKVLFEPTTLNYLDSFV